MLKLQVSIKGFELARMDGNVERAKEMNPRERKFKEHTHRLWFTYMTGPSMLPSFPKAKSGAFTAKRLSDEWANCLLKSYINVALCFACDYYYPRSPR